jgi:hypothetical protein
LDAITLAFLALGGLGGIAFGAFAMARRKSAGGRPKPALNELLKQLPPELAGRYVELVEMEKRIRQTVKAHGLEPVMGEQLSKLDYLVDSYMRLAQEAARVRGHLQATPPGMVEKEAERIRERLAGAEGETAILMQQNLAVVEKRLEKLEQIRTAAASLKAQLDTIEDTIRLIDDQALTASRTDDFHVDFDRVIAGVEATDAALAEARALMGDRAHVTGRLTPPERT